MASNGKAFIYLIFGFFLGLFFIYKGIQKYLLLQKINNTPTSKVASAAVGLVELFGNAKCSGDTKSPIAKAKCAYWIIQAQYYKSGKHSGWYDIYKCDSGEQFYLEDETGKMLINPENAQIVIPSDHTYEGHISEGGIFGMFRQKTNSTIINFLNETADEEMKKRVMAHQGQNIRLIEYYVADSDPLYVLGSAEPRNEVASNIAYENLIVQKGRYDKIMYISDSHERKIADQLKPSMLLHIAGGLALSAGCLFIILLMLQI